MCNLLSQHCVVDVVVVVADGFDALRAQRSPRWMENGGG
jgi:hypothetical protein